MGQGAEIARCHVIFAGPDQLHGATLADLFGDMHALRHIVRLEVRASAKGAAGKQGLDLNGTG